MYASEEDRGKFYRSRRWQRKAEEAKKRDNYECQDCKERGRLTLDSERVPGERKKPRLNVDHIEELEKRPDLALELSNLRTLCIQCHNRKHGRYVSQAPKWPDEWY